MTPSEDPETPGGRSGTSGAGVGSDSDATRAAVRAAAELEATRVASESDATPPSSAADDRAPAAADSSDVSASAGEEPAPETEAEDEPEDEDEDEDADDEPAADAPKRRRRLRRGGGSDQPPVPPPAPSRRRPRRDPGAPIPVVRAQAKYVRSSARKARLVCDHIRGKSVEEARAILAVTPRAIARDWSKLLESAVANAEHNHELVGEDLYIKAVKADEGPTIKRFRPRAMGRASKIRKRTSHLTILLTPKE
jgi:ribosomal protein L22